MGLRGQARGGPRLGVRPGRRDHARSDPGGREVGRRARARRRRRRRTRRAVDTVVAGAEADGDAIVVVVLDDPALLAQVRAAVGDRGPVVWWSSQVPSPMATTLAARWADGLLVTAMPDDGIVRVPTWIVGTGVDLRSRGAGPAPPATVAAPGAGSYRAEQGLDHDDPRGRRRPQQRGRHPPDDRGPVDERGRAPEPARARDPREGRGPGRRWSRSATRSNRRRWVRSSPRPTRSIDASADDDLRPASLEAIVAGRPVLTSNRRLARMLPGDDLALDFEPGNAQPPRGPDRPARRDAAREPGAARHRGPGADRARACTHLTRRAVDRGDRSRARGGEAGTRAVERVGGGHPVRVRSARDTSLPGRHRGA